MTTPDDVVAAARGYLNVRCLHQGRSRHGVDCVGLIVRVAHDLGLSTFDQIGYGRMPDGTTLRRVLKEQCQERPLGSMAAGMVALMRFAADPTHVGFLVPYRHGGLALVHALARARVGKVAEHRLDVTWQRRICGVFDLPGVQRT